ncbi:MAG: hypothetical protein R2911_23195 [Caldilineaceae bacterium]
MHPINGLQLDEWANEHHQQAITRAQRELAPNLRGRNSASPKDNWLRSGANILVNGWCGCAKRQTFPRLNAQSMILEFGQCIIRRAHHPDGDSIPAVPEHPQTAVLHGRIHQVIHEKKRRQRGGIGDGVIPASPILMPKQRGQMGRLADDHTRERLAERGCGVFVCPIVKRCRMGKC